MNDEELITLVREQRTAVPMTTPVEQIISRGRSVRARRRLPVLAGAAAAARERHVLREHHRRTADPHRRGVRGPAVPAEVSVP